MGETVTLDRRFCGPPDSANGGYVCGVFARTIEGPAQVTLRLPPPLGVPMERESDGQQVRFVHEGALVGEAEPASRTVDAAPEPVPFDAAAEAATRSWIVQHPDHHPFPTCFVCGPRRTEGDGLRVFVGPVPGRNEAAAAWVPDESLPLAGDGRVAPEIVWAVLDCAGGIGSGYVDAELDMLEPHVLGRFVVDVREQPLPGDRCTVLGWRIGREGRKVFAGSALYDEGGRVLARGTATWIALRSPDA